MPPKTRAKAKAKAKGKSNEPAEVGPNYGVCTHVEQINAAHVLKKLDNPSTWRCHDCGTTASVWVCLCCGHYGCGRYARHHSLHHFKSTKHPLAMELESKGVHCYDCDFWVLQDNTRGDMDLLRSQKVQLEDPGPDSSLALEKTAARVEHLDRMATALRRWQSREIYVAFKAWWQAVQANKAIKAKAQDGTTEAVNKKLKPLWEGPVTKKGQTGMRNLGNTCYVNSVLQALSNVGSFRDFFLEVPPELETDEPVQIPERKGCSAPPPPSKAGPIDYEKLDVPHRAPPGICRTSTIECFAAVQNKQIKEDDRFLTRELSHLMRVVWSGNWAVVTPHAVVAAVWRAMPMFKGYQQQDAQEFLTLLLDRLDQECKIAAANVQKELQSGGGTLFRTHSIPVDHQPANRLENLVTDLFGGETKTVAKCMGCGDSSTRTEPFLVLSVDVPHNGVRGSSDNTKAWRMRHCRIEDCIERLLQPEILTADCGWRCEKCGKCPGQTRTTTIARWPKVLVLHLKRFDWTRTSRSKLDANVKFPLTGLDVRSVCPGGPDPGGVYDLQAVVSHEGNGWGSGHYLAHCLNGLTGNWYLYNDNRVSAVPTKSIDQLQAYVLMYQLNPSDKKGGTPPAPAPAADPPARQSKRTRR
eukprot:CAMPEP_0114544662 /NCGR_PEP_ID=MMETSP0114-20121206/2994_1 /TAXON_ID=31324 /ORGANISM="Goniomonas sp, Strain m" /LENGTH=638 /DNA_ID=CAMNT_0001729053 /DNA_START=8 /DNA_END=1924 /DNA_ORIENTATION=+